MANPRQEYMILTMPDTYHHQKTLCLKDGHKGSVTPGCTEVPGGWNDTGKRLNAVGMAEYLAQAEANRIRIEAETAEAEKRAAAAYEIERARLINEYPYLIRVTGDWKADKLTPTKNLRKLLAMKFPGVKFSVRSTDRGTIYISWTDGPRAEAVKAIGGMFQGLSFDGMQDLESCVSSPFTDLFGRAGYVIETRHVSEEYHRAAAAYFGRGYDPNWNYGYEMQHHIREKMNELATPEQFR